MVFPLKHHGLPTKENEGYFWLLIKNPLPLFNKNPTTFSDFFKLNSAQAARKDLVSLAGRLFCALSQTFMSVTTYTFYIIL